MPQVALTIENGIARILIDHPERHNAMTFGMWQQLAQHFETIAQAPEVRVVVLSGAGGRAFVSGADISEFEHLRDSAEQVQRYEDTAQLALNAIAACERPVIAAIEGICMGGGLGLAGAADLRYANRSARFRMPAARLGVGYSLHGVQRLVQLIGQANTADIFYTARIFDAPEALRLNFIHAFHEDGEFHAAIERIAANIAGNAPLPIRAAKLALRTLSAGHAIDAAATHSIEHAVQACFDSADYREGRSAFLEKRPPAFKGH